MVCSRLLKWNEQPEVLLYWVHVSSDFRFPFASCVRHHQSSVYLIDCIRRLIGHSTGGWISSRAASPPAASPPSSILQDEPLFHVVISTDQRRPSPFQYRDLFHKRLMDKKHVRKQLYSTVLWVYPLFIICVYIFSIRKCYVVDECSVWLLVEWNQKYSLRGSWPTCYTQSPLGISAHIVTWGWLL